MAIWIEDLDKDSFKICLRETKIFDGTHKNITIVSEKHFAGVLSLNAVFLLAT